MILDLCLDIPKEITNNSKNIKKSGGQFMFQELKPNGKNLFSQFTRKYGLSKTLKFELKPEPETKQHLEYFIEQDTERAKEYKKLKKIIDQFHKDYIELSLSHKDILDKEKLTDFFKLWSNNKEDKEFLDKIKEKHNLKLKKKTNNKDAIKTIQQQFREDIVEFFKNQNPLLERFFQTAHEDQLLKFLDSFDKNLHKEFKEKKDKNILEKYLQEPRKVKSIAKSVLFSKDFIQYLLPVWVKNSSLTEKEEKQKTIENFTNFTTYLQGFYKNRGNMYSDKEEGTAISHRIVNENLPKFLRNLQAYKKIKSNHKDLEKDFEKLRSNFKEEFNYFSLQEIENLFQPEFFNKCFSQKGIDHYNTLMGGKVLENGKKLHGINEYINLYRQKKEKENKKKDIKIKISKNNLPFMELLYKQILSDRESHSFIPEEFESKKELLEALTDFWENVWIKKSPLTVVQSFESEKHSNSKEEKNVLCQLKQLLTDLSDYELDGIYFKSSDLHNLSHLLFKNHGAIRRAIKTQYDKMEAVWKEYEKSLAKRDQKDKLKKSRENVTSFKQEFKQAIAFYSKQKNTKINFSDNILESYFVSSNSFKKKEDENYVWKDFYSLAELNESLYFYFYDIIFNEITTQQKAKPENNLKNFREKVTQHLSSDINTDFLDPILDSYFESLSSTGNNVLESYISSAKNNNILSHWFKHRFEKEKSLDFYLQNQEKQSNNDKLKTFLSHIEDSYKSIQEMPQINKEFTASEKEQIKTFLDLLLNLLQLIKFLYLENNKRQVNIDTKFYNPLDFLYEETKPIVKLYNQTRNFIAKNKNRLKKIKINFEDSTLLNGWDLNKESDNLAVLLRRKDKVIGYKYYLGVMNKNKKANKLFDYHLGEDDSEKKTQEKKQLKEHILHQEADDNFYEKMNYKLLPDPSKMLPKVFFSNKNLSYFNPSQDIMRIKESKTYAKNDGQDFLKSDCHKLIDFYKESLKKHKEWNHFFDFRFSPTEKYNDIGDFFNEVKNQGYQLQFDKIKSSYIKDKVEAGELLLFQVYSKDFSTKTQNRTQSKDNLHTLYFKGLFKEENLKDLVLKLNGEAEIFYRKATKEKKITHPKNQEINNKNSSNQNKKSKFPYDLVKDKRFTEDKYFFHFPITLNFKNNKMKAYPFNQEVLKFLNNNKEINIIGIDRGERHLAYYTIINQKGEILKQGSFNHIEYSYKDKNHNEVKVKKDYHALLDKKETERNKNRKNWNKIENIKELKQGYLSHLVYQIAKLMIDNNAIVVFEDLNSGFKRGRFKFEKQVYQNLEKALISKLNYLVFKDKKPSDLGGYLNAYQLTAPFESFKTMGNQTGFVFYTPARYTSVVCPSTGFINLIQPKYESVEKSKAYFKNFDKIYFEEDHFVFEYQDGKVNPSRKSQSNDKWKVCTHGAERYQWNKKDKEHTEVNVTEKLKNLFKENGIEYKQIPDLKLEVLKQEKKDFFKDLTHLLRLTLQLRHINSSATDEKEKDFILSPIADKSGNFFDSRKATEKEPQNADANGAYHIALKGLMTLKSITANDKNKLNLDKTLTENKTWFEFIRKQKTTKQLKAS